MKKTLSFLLALTILLGILPFSAAAKSTINEVKINVTRPAGGGAYGYIPTIPDEYASMYSISKWSWYNETTAKSMVSTDYTNKYDSYSITLVLNSGAEYNFANNGIKHTFSVIDELAEAGKYSTSITRAESASLGDGAVVKITFPANKKTFSNITLNYIPTVQENYAVSYNYSVSSGSINKLLDYDNGTTVKNGVMWEDISDINNIKLMKAGDKFIGTHTYRITFYVKAYDEYEYDYNNGKVIVNNSNNNVVEALDLDYEGYATRLKITYVYPVPAHRSHFWETTRIVPATTQSDGVKDMQCSVCGACVENQVIPCITFYQPSTEYFIYTKNPYHKLPLSIESKDTNKYYYLKYGKDYDVVFKNNGESIYNPSYPTLKKLPLGTYDYQVRFKGDFGGVVNRKFTVALGAPRMTYSASTTTIKFSWKSIEGATFYRVFQKNLKTGKVTCVAKKVTGTSFVVKNKTAGTKYSYAVRAYRTTRTGKTYCSGYSFENVYTRCVAPTVKAKVSGNKVKLYWTPIKGARSYTVYKYNGGKEVYEQFKTPVKTRSMTFIAVKGKFYFKVAANGQNGRTGEFSKPIKVVVK